MRHRLTPRTILPITLAVLIAPALAPAPAAAQPDDAKLARQVAQTSTSVQPGDVVIVYGGKHTLPLMETIAIEVQKAGGLANMMLLTDRVIRSRWTEVQDEYLAQVPEYWGPWLRAVDVWIGLPAIEDPPKVFGDIPQERFALASAGNQMFNDMLNSTPLRGVGIVYPTASAAEQSGLSFEVYAAMQWDAIGADYGRISEVGKSLAEKLRTAKQIRVTSPAGTDLVFSLAGRPIFIEDGIVTPEDAKSELFLERWSSLPAGQVFTAVDETSANGKVVVPETRCQYKPMTGIRLEVREGDIRSFEAETNASCYEEAVKPYEGPATRLGSFSIGLNPKLKVMEEGEASYRPGDAAGMVFLTFGDNQLLGGKNMTTGGFSFPVTQATVEVDGAAVVRGGALVGG